MNIEIKARLNYLRIAPRKVRLVANLIKGKSVTEAKKILHFLVKKSASPMLKLLNSAINNAKNKFNLDENDLYIKNCIVNEGYKLKRWMPKAFGRASLIKKRTSRIEMILGQNKLPKSDKILDTKNFDQKQDDNKDSK